MDVPAVMGRHVRDHLEGKQNLALFQVGLEMGLSKDLEMGHLEAHSMDRLLDHSMVQVKEYFLWVVEIVYYDCF